MLPPTGIHIGEGELLKGGHYAHTFGIRLTAYNTFQRPEWQACTGSKTSYEYNKFKTQHKFLDTKSSLIN